MYVYNNILINIVFSNTDFDLQDKPPPNLFHGQRKKTSQFFRRFPS